MSARRSSQNTPASPERTPLLNINSPNDAETSSHLETESYHRRNSGNALSESVAEGFATWFGRFFRHNRTSFASNDGDDLAHIYSYMGESIIVSILSCCCLVSFIDSFTDSSLHYRLHYLLSITQRK